MCPPLPEAPIHSGPPDFVVCHREEYKGEWLIRRSHPQAKIHNDSTLPAGSQRFNPPSGSTSTPAKR